MFWSGIKLLPVYLAFAGLLLFSGCKQEEIRFRGISRPKVESVSATTATISVNALFYNPNRQGGKVKNVDIDIEVNGEKVAKILSLEKTRVKPRNEFQVPLSMELPLNSKALSNGILGIIKGRKTSFKYYGNIEFRSFLTTYKVPIEFEDDITIRLR